MFEGRWERREQCECQNPKYGKVTFNGLRRKIAWPFPSDFRDESSGLQHPLVQIGQAGSI